MVKYFPPQKSGWIWRKSIIRGETGSDRLVQCTLVLKSMDLLYRFAHESGLYCFTQSRAWRKLKFGLNTVISSTPLFVCGVFTDCRMRSGLASADCSVRGEGNSRDGLPSPRPDHLWAWRLTAYCCIALQRLSCSSGTVKTAGNGFLSLALWSPASPPQTRWKGCCSTIYFCPRVSSPHAWGLCCVYGVQLCLSLKPQWPTLRNEEGPSVGGIFNFLHFNRIRN